MSIEIARCNFNGRVYTHPGNPEHVIRIYRRFIIEHKTKLGGPYDPLNPRKRKTHRGLMKYRVIVEEYLAAKRKILVD